MPITVEVQDLQVSTEDYLYQREDFSAYQMMDSPNTSENTDEKIYRYMAGDVEHPTTVRVGVYNKPDSDKTSVSIKKRTWLKVTDDNGVVLYKPFEIVTAVNGPYLHAVDSAGVETALLNTLSWLISLADTPVSTVTIASYNGGNRDRLKFGVTELPISTIADPPA